jgi:hypothetical protein|tara:strand:- start:955 stop:1209 length:255 start_codon:yes stop_codon:yes gene_type:complete
MQELDISINYVSCDSKGNQSREHASATTNKLAVVDIIDKFAGVLTTLGFDNQVVKDGIAEYAYCNCNLDILESEMNQDDDETKK